MATGSARDGLVSTPAAAAAPFAVLAGPPADPGLLIQLAPEELLYDRRELGACLAEPPHGPVPDLEPAAPAEAIAIPPK
jgi:hypothetical protein